MPTGPGDSSGDGPKINQTKYHLAVLRNAQNPAPRRIQAVTAIGKLLIQVENPSENVLDSLIQCYETEMEGNVKAAVFQRTIQIFYPSPKAKELFFKTLDLSKDTPSLLNLFNPSILTEVFCLRNIKLENSEIKELLDFLDEYKSSAISDDDSVISLGTSMLLFTILNSDSADPSYVRQHIESSSWKKWLEVEKNIGNDYAHAVLSSLYPKEFGNPSIEPFSFSPGILSLLNTDRCIPFEDETSLSMEELKEIYDELSIAPDPMEFLQSLLQSGKRVIAVNAYNSDLLLLDHEILQDFTSLMGLEEYKITHFGVPLHKSYEGEFYKFLSGKDSPVIDKLISDCYSTDVELEDFDDAKEIFRGMLTSFLSIGAEILFYGGESGLEGELLSENKASKIKEVLDANPLNRVLLYGANYELAKDDIDYSDLDPKVSFVKTLSEIVGEEAVVSVLTQDEDCWEMLDLNLLDMLQVLPMEYPDVDLKDFGVTLNDKKIGKFRFSLSSLQNYSDAFDGLIFRRTWGDDGDDDDDGENPLDDSPVDSPELAFA